ncbi:DNA photolyase family protein [Alphaproteobacteria bacterium]|jgi:deoxyribodipyrimidine photo-lyase|nr:DNA photolyase family protein [Alphaproteobacteria bacterium]
MTSSTQTSAHCIHWFRQDLRLGDNPALSAAAANGTVLPIYILDDENAGPDRMGSASRWWLHHSLNALNESLAGKLRVFSGDPAEILPALAAATGASSIVWNRCYEPWRMTRDTKLKEMLGTAGLNVTSYNGALLWEPWDIKKDDGTPYKVFTPFFRRGCLNAASPRMALPVPERLELASGEVPHATSIDRLGLLPSQNWQHQLEGHWVPGEAGAKDRLSSFLDEGLAGYKKGRDFPARPNVSRLSPRLHWGEISPNQAWYAAKDVMDSGQSEGDADKFMAELGWREFSHALLYQFPELPRQNLQPKFDEFPWQENADHLRRWQTGQTGYPIVDAAMRSLWQTGYMHNRLRMVVGSFLVKNLRLHWHHGEAWFWDTLVDADLASNSASWQWIAGCGADAAPYFRVFNPVMQGEKFDTDGSFTKRYVPELAHMPDKFLFNPWAAPLLVLAEAGVKLGENYPEPMVDVRQSREEALAAFASLKQT